MFGKTNKMYIFSPNGDTEGKMKEYFQMMSKINVDSKMNVMWRNLHWIS